MRKYILLLLLTGCATPTTTLSNGRGSVVQCGGGTAGSIAGGFWGYRIQESHDHDCVTKYKSEGYHIN